ncbi:MAG: S-layer homology domain-containing protein [Candidatus Aquicultor sp.]
MPDTRPAIILITYLAAMVVIQIFASTGNPADQSKKRFVPHEPKISVHVSGEDTAAIGKSTTYEVKVKVDSRDTTVTTVDVSDMVNLAAGAAIDIASTKPSLLSTEPIGDGIKINWGKFRLIGGQELKIKLKVKTKREGMAINTALAMCENGKTEMSNNLTTFLVPPPVESTSTTTTTTTAFDFSLSGLSNTSSRPSVSGKSSSEESPKGDGAPKSTSNNDRIGFNGWSNNWDFGGEEPASSARKVEEGIRSTIKRKRAVNPKPGEGIETTTTAAFRDIGPGEWFAADIGDLVTWDIIGGYPDATFRPAAPVSRAEFTTLIMRGAGVLKRGPEPFVDVRVDDWFYPAVASAYNLELVEGVSQKIFAPGDKLTREQAATIAIKAAKLPVETDFEKQGSWLQGFSDRYSISEWARPYAAAVLKYNLIKGYADNKFEPQGLITRAEATILIHRLFFEKRSMLIETPDYVKPTPSDVSTVINR